jgi:hypothetical protein
MVQSSKRKISVKKTDQGKVTSKKAAITRKSSVKRKAAIKKSVTTKKLTEKNVASKPAKAAIADIPSVSISPEERWKRIAIAAYQKAEARGFAPGNEVQDWLDAEQEIDDLIPR